MRFGFFTVFFSLLLLHTIGSAQSDFATVTIRANNSLVSVTIDGHFFEIIRPGKSLSFGVNLGDKKQIILEDNEGNKFAKEITITGDLKGKVVFVAFPSVPGSASSPRPTSPSPVIKANPVKGLDSLEKIISDSKIKAQKSVSRLKETIEKIEDGKINYTDAEATSAYSEAKLFLHTYRLLLQEYAAYPDLDKQKNLFLKKQADSSAMKKVVGNYEAIRDGKRPSSKSVIIAFKKNRVRDLPFWITAKNVTDTLIDEKTILFYALQQKCNAAVINYLIKIASGKEEFINYNKYSFLPPNDNFFILPLTHACINGDTSVVNLLIDAKAGFYPATLDEKRAKDHVRFLWNQFGHNPYVKNIIKRRMPGFPNPFADKDEAVSDIASNMVFVEGGKFKMGCDGVPVECGRAWPAVELTVGSFYISKFELTQRQWYAIMEEYPGYTKNCNTCPVEQVSWDNVQLFIQKLNKLTGKKYRLPSEKEWEFAARGGTKSQNYKYSGSNNIDSVSWCKLTGNSLQPVGKKQPNEIGLYDMSGNVFEWCSSFFTETLEIYLKFPEGVTNGVERVIKGGSWRQSEFHSQVMRRSKAYPDEASADIGFRLASDQ